MEESLGAKIRRNTRSALLTFFWGQLLNVTRMLVLFHYLAPEGYGLWVFAFSVTSYFTIYNFGISNAFVKYTAEYSAHRDHERLSGLISTGMAVAVAFAALVAAILLLFTDQAVDFFNISSERRDEARFVVTGIGLTSAFNIAFNAYPALLTGIQRLYVVNYCRVSVLTFEVGLTFYFLYLGHGLRTVMLVYMAGVILSGLTTAYFAHRALPELRIAPWRAEWGYFKEMLNLGSRMQLLGIVALVVSTLDIVVFMKFGSEALVGLYAIAQRVADRAQGVARQGFGALAPASAELLSRQDTAKAAHVYDTAQRFTALISAYIFGYISMNPDFVMRFVMDEQYDPISVWVLRWVAVANAIHALTGPGSSMLRGAGMPMREVIYQVLIFVLFIGSFYPLLVLYGDTSTIAEHSFRTELLLTWPLALSAGSLVFILMANRFFGVARLSPFNRMLPLMAASLGLAWAAHALWFAVGLPQPTGRWDGLVACLVTGGIYSVGFAAAVLFLPGLNQSDRSQLRKFIPGASRFFPPQV